MAIKLELNLYLDLPSRGLRVATGLRVFDRRSLDVAYQAALAGAFGNVSKQALRVDGRIIYDSESSEPYVELFDANLVVRAAELINGKSVWVVNPTLLLYL